MIGQADVLPGSQDEEPVAGRTFSIIMPAGAVSVSAVIDHSPLEATPNRASSSLLSLEIPPQTEGRRLTVTGQASGKIANEEWIIRPPKRSLTSQQMFDSLSKDLSRPSPRSLAEYQSRGKWSYGDVENNGIYYHPTLTHYAHQRFEDWFYQRTGIEYVDLSRETERSQQRRLLKGIPRMTFAVIWLHQYMTIPMEAGDSYTLTLDTIELCWKRIGVRAWVLNEAQEVAAVVMWVRVPLLLPKREPTSVPHWFPRLPVGWYGVKPTAP